MDLIPARMRTRTGNWSGLKVIMLYCTKCRGSRSHSVDERPHKIACDIDTDLPPASISRLSSTFPPGQHFPTWSQVCSGGCSKERPRRCNACIQRHRFAKALTPSSGRCSCLARNQGKARPRPHCKQTGGCPYHEIGDRCPQRIGLWVHGQ